MYEHHWPRNEGGIALQALLHVMSKFDTAFGLQGWSDHKHNIVVPNMNNDRGVRALSL